MLLDEDPARAFVPYPAAEVPGAETGPLAGLTFAVKDLYDVAGYPTGGGSPALLARSGIKRKNAAAVQVLLDAGARFVGKTHTDEFAFSMNGKNAHFGTPVNGGARDRIPGGSSSGSASAVSNGLCDLALGSDTGGSVRAPASHCGLFGIRPTHGRISLEGCLPLASSFDTCGFFARKADVFERAATALLGRDTAPLPENPRLLVAADCFAMLDKDVRAALAPHVARIEELLGKGTMVEAAGAAGFTPLYWAFRRIQGREAWRADGAVIDAHRMPLGPGVAERFAYSRDVTDQQVGEAEVAREEFRKAFAALVGPGTVMLLPSMPDIAPLLSDDEASLENYRNGAVNILCLSGLSGTPQVSIPMASRLKAPLGLSLLGPVGSDLDLVRLACRLAGS